MRKSRKHFSIFGKGIVFLYWSVWIVVVLCLIGKQNVVQPFQEGIYNYSTGVSTISVLYPKEITGKLIEYMNIHYERPPDKVIEDMAIEYKYKTLLVVPSYFQHVGYWSSNPDKTQGNANWVVKSRTFVP